MPHVAFATYREGPDIDPDDRPVAAALERAGVAVTPAVWDDPGVEWRAFDAVVIRSTWDYHLRPGEYEAWVRRFTAPGPRLWNPPTVVFANLHKSYLTRLPNAVPTELVAAGSGRELRAVLERRGWDEAVVKPAVSAGAVGTWRISRADADEHRFSEQLRAADLLVQPYLREVESVGEWSLMFFETTYSHAVLKHPASGDFRVQEHLGGCSCPAEATPELVAQAHAALAAIDAPLLYARIDGVERDGQLIVTELEVTEPSLYLALGNGAADRFAQAILRTLGT
jgi:glutathione synthase/RimK-type ligase-like ATP-grasp enzyme